MRVNGNRGAAPCYANTNGILSHGIWFVQTIQVECQPKKSIESILHFSRALFTREYGLEIETNKDANFCGNIKVVA